MRKIPTFRDVICVVCGKLIPGYNRTNNRQKTCKGACQKQYHAALNRKSSRDQYARDVKSEPHHRKSARFCRGIREDGIHVPEGTVLLDMKWVRFIRAGYKREKSQARSLLIQRNLFWQMHVDNVSSRKCVGNEPGSPLLNFHEYTASNGKRGVKWYNSGQSAYCIVYLWDGTLSFRYDVNSDTFTFWPGSATVNVKNEGTPLPGFDRFDVASFREYLKRITPWVLEGLHEAWCKEAVEKHCPPPWITKLLGWSRTPRLTERSECSGTYSDCCDRNKPGYYCHAVMDSKFPPAGPEGAEGPYRVVYYEPNNWSEPTYFMDIQKPKPLPADVTEKEIETARKKLNARINRKSRVLTEKPSGLFENV